MGCYFNILEMDLEDSIDIIVNCVNQKYEDRTYFTYVISQLFAEERITYTDYIGKLRDSNTQVTEIEKQEIRNKANNMLNKLCKKGGE